MAESAGIQSLDRALEVLAALAARSGPASLTDLAREMNMPASKVHRYLASFVNAGLVEQAGRSGKYDLGANSLALGLAAMSRLDLVNRTADALPRITEETGLTALLTVWADAGPTIVRWERAAGFIVTTLGLGTTMPLLTSASGRVFLAHAPARVTENVLKAELVTASVGSPEMLADDVRSQGYAHVAGDLIPGLAAIAAPVLNWQGEIEAAVTLIGTDRSMTHPDHAAVAVLRAFCKSLSVAP